MNQILNLISVMIILSFATAVQAASFEMGGLYEFRTSRYAGVEAGTQAILVSAKMRADGLVLLGFEKALSDADKEDLLRENPLAQYGFSIVIRNMPIHDGSLILLRRGAF